MFKTILRAVSRPATAALLLAASTTASAQIEPRFMLEGVLQENVGFLSRCPAKFGGTIAGHGYSKAMYQTVAFIATDCITQQGPLYNFTQGKFIVMDQFGDQLFADYSGQFVPTGDGTKYVFSGATFQVTGGTGKYARAKGGGTMTGGEDMATGAGTIKLSGDVAFGGRL